MGAKLRSAAIAPAEVQMRAANIFEEQTAPPGGRVGYIHQPFCEKLCRFCSFFRVLKDEEALDKYMDALIEAIYRSGETPYAQSAPFDAFYLGGGTPTTVSLEQMNRLMKAIRESFAFTDNVEFTSESTFANITDEMLDALKEGGVKRMSLGVQTFAPRLRKVIGRVCEPEDVIRKIGMVCKKMEIVNLDLIFNFPTQTLEEWEEDLKIAMETDVTTVSTHTLVPVKDSPLAQMEAQGEIEPMGDEKKQYEFYSMAQRMLGEKGFKQINFCFHARSPKERIYYFRHRFQEGDCFGFGPSAVGNYGDFICFNFPSVERYIQMVKAGQFPAMVAGSFEGEAKVSFSIAEEFLAATAVDKRHYREYYGVDLNERYGEILTRLAHDGLIEDGSDSFAITPLGLFWVHNMGMLFQE
jgi:oxygen-independent coproporphyrinogen-3 oxidase